MMILHAILCLALSQNPQALPHVSPEERIEAELKAKVEKPEFQSTQGQVEATDEATQAYKQEIERVYKKLLAGLPPAERASLIASQSAWNKYAAAEGDSIGLIDCRKGTIHRTASALALKDLYRHRLEELTTRFDDFSDEDFETLPDTDSQPVTLKEWKQEHDRHHRPRLQPR